MIDSTARIVSGVLTMPWWKRIQVGDLIEAHASLTSQDLLISQDYSEREHAEECCNSASGIVYVVCHKSVVVRTDTGNFVEIRDPASEGWQGSMSVNVIQKHAEDLGVGAGITQFCTWKTKRMQQSHVSDGKGKAEEADATEDKETDLKEPDDKSAHKNCPRYKRLKRMADQISKSVEIATDALATLPVTKVPKRADNDSPSTASTATAATHTTKRDVAIQLEYDGTNPTSVKVLKVKMCKPGDHYDWSEHLATAVDGTITATYTVWQQIELDE